MASNISELDIRCSNSCTRAGLAALFLSAVALMMLQPLTKTKQLNAHLEYLVIRVAMKDMLVKFDQKFERDLDRLLSQRRPKADDVRAVYDLGKQAYSLSHDLLDLTNQREFKRPWNIRARLGEDLAMMIHEMFVPSFRKPPVGRPWADLYEVVKETI